MSKRDELAEAYAEIWASMIDFAPRESAEEAMASSIKAYRLGHNAGWDARQPEIDELKREVDGWKQLHENNEACINNQLLEIKRLNGNISFYECFDPERLKEGE